MKKILQSSFIIIFAAVYGQNISNFEYVSVASKTGNLESGKYGLSGILNSKLKAAKYDIISESNESWPDAAKNNPCGVLKAEIEDTSTFLKNKIQVNFKDCSGKTVASFEGKSNIKEYEPGFKDALNVALRNLPASNPEKLAVINETPKQNVAIAAEPVKSTSSQTQKSNVKTESKAQTFSNGTLNLNRIYISENQFILASPNNSMPYAIFKESTKKEVYRIQLHDGSQTLGYLEDGNIIIEVTNNDGSFKKEIFTQK